MTYRLKRNILRTAKHHFKAYPKGDITIHYETMDPNTGCIGVTVYKYKDFASELGYLCKHKLGAKTIEFCI